MGRKLAMLCCLVGLLAIAPTGASAAPVATALDSPGNGDAPLIAYDPSSSTTYVAWDVETDPSGSDPLSSVDVCVLPSGATACEGGGPTLLTDSAYPGETVLTGLTVLPGGKVAVTAGTDDSHNTGTVAWVSAKGGAGFLASGGGLINGGAVTSPLDGQALGEALSFGDTIPLSATDVGLLGTNENAACSSIAQLVDSGLGSGSGKTPTCHASSSVNYDGVGDLDISGAYFAIPESSGPSIAAEPEPGDAANDVVVGIGYGDKATTGCAAGGDTGYGAVASAVNANSTSAGTLNGDGLPAYGLLDCSAVDPTLTAGVLTEGGQAGIGVLEGEGTANGSTAPTSIDYRPFTATTHGGSFGAPVQLGTTAAETDGSVPVGFQFGNLDLTEDTTDGVYAIWDTSLNLELDYSSNGGASWGTPVVIPPPTGLPDGSGPGEAQIVGTGSGNLELVYNDGTEQGTGQAQVYLEPINYQALLADSESVAVTTTQFSGEQNSGSSITVAAGTTGEFDLASLTGTDGSTAGGTVTYGLYSTSTCTAASEVFAGGTEPVSDGLAMPSGQVTTALASGTYYWMDSYSGDGSHTATTSPCGSEVLTVSPAAATPGSGSTGSGSGTSNPGTGGTGSTGSGSKPPAGTGTGVTASTKPAVAGAGLSGLTTGHPRLVFSAAKAASGSKLTSVTITLPTGLRFVKAGLKKGLILTGGKLERETLSGSKLTLTLKSAVTKLKVTLTDRALSETSALKSEIKRHKITSLTVTVVAAAGKVASTTKLKLKA